ncbi:HNH endonuclease [Vibrio phage D164]
MRKICTFPGCTIPVEVEHFDRESPRCPSHPLAPRARKEYKHHYHKGSNFYWTNTWKKLRASYIDEHPLCESCLRFDILEDAVVVDHIKELADGGSHTDRDNLQSLCDSCHKRKTAAERRKRNNSKSQFKSINQF